MNHSPQKLLTTSALLVASAWVASSALAAPACPAPWHCEQMILNIPPSSKSISLRAGYYPESAPFRGNILYFEGLGDSMLNHAPLFSRLSTAGFRVLAFDYQGQGGSSGTMNDTRIASIPSIGEKIWNRFARDLKNFPDKSIIGWSTGGLAAYVAATEGNVDQVVLIAPGIAPKKLVGAGILNWPVDEITIESLTTAAPYRSSSLNPHLDPIRPNSPVKIPKFSFDLFTTAYQMKKTPISKSIRGFVLLSGAEDTYVDAKKTENILKKTAPHFERRTYAGALHEIDNERLDISEQASRDILDFLTKP
jgi:alpha-beta hydrolase superfamily lysophospholipase